MPDARRVFGDQGEDLAVEVLKKRGMKILERQYSTRFGEIDLIAEDGDEIVFVEVKTRQSSEFGYPEEAVTASKLRKIMSVGEEYLRKSKLEHRPYRIDVVAIESDQEPPRVTHLVGVGE